MRCAITWICVFSVCMMSLVACSDTNDNTSDGDVEEENQLVDGDNESEMQEAAEEDFDAEKIMDGDQDQSESDMSEAEMEEENYAPIKPYDCLNDAECTQLMVASHRGYSKDHPENSVAALRAAAAIGALFVEVDVRDTLDGKLVIMHDSDVNRTTDGFGNVSDLTYAELSALKLNDAEEGNPESYRIPTFSEVLLAAREEGVMLYVDQKTDRSDLVLEAIQQGQFYEHALVRAGLDRLLEISAEDNQVMLMPPVETKEEFERVLENLPEVKIVEIAMLGANKEFAEIILNAGVKIQQDTFAGDMLALVGDYTGWKNYLMAGVLLMQTEMPHLLQPAVNEYNQSGEFPESGPGDLK